MSPAISRLRLPPPLTTPPAPTDPLPPSTSGDRVHYQAVASRVVQ